jgi:hypothetical protein
MRLGGACVSLRCAFNFSDAPLKLTATLWVVERVLNHCFWRRLRPEEIRNRVSGEFCL